AGSLKGQAERWLRILRQYGDAAVILTSLGFVDAPSEPESPHAIDSPSGLGIESDPVAVVTSRARVAADDRGAEKVHTADILAALMDVYGATFAAALQQHGI